MELHPNFLESVQEAKELFSGIPPNTIKQQNDISQYWMAKSSIYVYSLFPSLDCH
jgi:hypothetical protein